MRQQRLVAAARIRRVRNHSGARVFFFLPFLFFFLSAAPPGIFGFRVMNAAPISAQAFAATSQFYQMTAIFSPYEMTKIISALFFSFFFLPVATFFSSRKCCDKGIQFCPSRSHATCRAQKQEQFKEDNEMFHLFFKCSLFFCCIR